MKISTVQVQLTKSQWGEEDDDLGTIPEKVLSRAHFLIDGWCQVERILIALSISKTFEAPKEMGWVGVGRKVK